MGEHCKDHISNIERVTKMEAMMTAKINEIEGCFADIDHKFDRFFVLHDDALKAREGMIATLAEIKSCGIKTAGRLDDIEAGIRKRTEYADSVVVWAKQKVDEFETADNMMAEKLRRLDESFQWFRDPVNKWRDRLPTALLKILLFLIAVLVLLHYTDVGSMLKKMVFK